MSGFDHFLPSVAHNWPVWLLSTVLVLAAAIDGWKLKVPNWITFPLVVGGWVYGTACFGWEGLGWSLVGTVVGLALLLPAYAIGGMGAGDVKLLAGVGAWVGSTDTLYAFCVSAIVGGAIALAHGPLATRLASPSRPVLEHHPGDSRGPRSDRLGGDGRRAQEHDAPAALWDSDCHWVNCLFSLDGDVAMRLAHITWI